MDRIETIKIAKKYRYLSDFAKETGWELPNGILDKQITGAGATHLAITDRHPTIIVSPRRDLIRNKCEQYDNLLWYEGDRTSHKDMDKFMEQREQPTAGGIVGVDKHQRCIVIH